MRVKVDVWGNRELKRKLDKMPPRLRNKAITKAARQAAKLTLRQAREMAPVDSGLLEQSLVVRGLDRKSLKEGTRLTKRQIRSLQGASVMTKDGAFRGETFYGLIVEFGTEPRTNYEGQNRGAIPKNTFSFLRPALYSHVSRKRRMFITHIRRFIREQHEPTK